MHACLGNRHYYAMEMQSSYIYLHLFHPFRTAAAPSQYDVHLFGGSNAMEGRVEIFYNGEWGTVCDDFWDLRDAIVVCRQLGYTTAVRRSIAAEFGEGTARIWRDNTHCSGTESQLSDCIANSWGSHNCYHRQDAGVVCASKFGYFLYLFLGEYRVYWSH